MSKSKCSSCSKDTKLYTPSIKTLIVFGIFVSSMSIYGIIKLVQYLISLI